MQSNKNGEVFIKKGIGLIEVIVYAGLLAMISALLVNFLAQIINTYYLMRAEREVIANGRFLVETLHKSIAQAEDVYAPTSRFDQNTGQLSLMTSQGATAEHTTAYVDFWLENGRLWMRREGEAPAPISGASVIVSAFKIERITQTLGVSAIRTTLQVDSALSKFAASATLYTTTALRGYY